MTSGGENEFSVYEILEARKYIYRSIEAQIKILANGSIDLTYENMYNLFDLYDQVFFKGQITEKIAELRSPLRFIVSSRTSGECAITGVKKEVMEVPERIGKKTFKTVKEVKVYYIDISPFLLHAIATNPRTKQKICSDELAPRTSSAKICDDLKCLMLIMEHQIIHLLILLYDPSLVEKYGEHGKLFRCISRSYFGNFYPHDLAIDGSTIITPRPYDTKKGYKNYANSCFIDSVLMILLDNKYSYWRDIIFSTDPSKTVYASGTCGFGNDEIVEAQIEIQNLAYQFQTAFRDDYDLLNTKGKTSEKCVDLRHILGRCDSDISSGRMYQSGHLYSAITDLFPLLKTRVQYFLPPDKKTLKLEQPKTLYEVADFVVNSDKKIYDWKLYDADILVFENGGVPRVKNFTELGREVGYNMIFGTKYSYDVTKTAILDFFILDGKYELVGLVMLHGISDKREGGNHFTSFYKISALAESTFSGAKSTKNGTDEWFTL